MTWGFTFVSDVGVEVPRPCEWDGERPDQRPSAALGCRFANGFANARSVLRVWRHVERQPRVTQCMLEQAISHVTADAGDPWSTWTWWRRTMTSRSAERPERTVSRAKADKGS